MSRSAGWLLVRSIRSLAGPGAFSSALRSLNVGRASCASGRSSARNGRSFLATGLESSTSGSRSSSAARRFRNVVFARRRNGGSCSTESASSCWREPIALVVVARWSTRPARSSLRSARSVTRLEDETTKRSSSRESELSSRNSREDACSDGIQVQQAGVELVAAQPVLVGGALDDGLEVLARLRVERVEDLVEVDRRRRVVLVDHAAVGDRRGLAAGKAQVDVAVGDAGDGGLPDGGERAAAQRRVVLVDLQGQLRLAVGRQLDVRDLAGRDAGYLHEVALDELRGVLEPRRDGVAPAAAADQQHAGEDHGDGDGDERGDPREWGCSSQVSPAPFPPAGTTAFTETCGNVCVRSHAGRRLRPSARPAARRRPGLRRAPPSRARCARARSPRATARHRPSSR